MLYCQMQSGTTKIRSTSRATLAMNWMARTTLSCRANRQWSEVRGRCAIVTCIPPVSPDHGSIRGTVFTYQSVITYECDRGYKTVGEPHRVCKETKEWSGEAAKCERITCADPEPIDNGFIEGTEYRFWPGGYV